jgi:uncharacterized membrane protein
MSRYSNAAPSLFLGALSCLVPLTLRGATALVPVLAISETPETTGINYYNGEAAFIYTLDYFLSPKSILADDFAVTQVGWQRTPKPFAGLSRSRALILWDAPRAVQDKRRNDPYYSDLEVISEEAASQIVKFVEEGGALVVAGGVTCYGNGHERLGSADYRKGKFRTYLGYAGSPLAAILPVEVPDAVTLRPLRERKGVRVVRSDPMIERMDLSQWGCEAYHKVKAREGAEVLVATAEGDPLVARWAVKKGRVVCVMLSPRGNALVERAGEGSDPIWPTEAVLWDRCLRWALGGKFPDEAREAKLVARYKALVADAPPVPLGMATAEFPYGTHVVTGAFPKSIAGLAMKYFADLGMNHIVSSGFSHIGTGKGTQMGPDAVDAYMKGYAEAAARHNLYVFIEPAPADGARLAGLDPKEWAQVTLPGGKFAGHYDSPRPCPFSPAVLQHAVEQVERWAPIAARHPRIRGAFCDDEWAWVMGYRNAYEGDPGVACYSPWANERFKRLTGKDAPPPVYREPGYVAPEDDLWLKWCQLMRQDAAADYNEALSKAAKKHRPDFLMSNYPGGFEGKSDVMVEEVYLDCWKESELEAFERLDVRANFREDAKRDKQAIYALIGIFRMPEDKSIYPETLRLTVGCCLGAGAKGIILWNSVNLWSPWFMHPGREPLDAEAKRLGEYLRKFGPMLLNLTKPESPVWMLSGWFWVNSFDNYYFLFPDPKGGDDKERTWWPFQISDIAGPAALRAGLPVEFVTEKQLMSQELFKRKAVILPGMLYCREAVVKNLESYTEQGGKVFVDQSTKVKIKGATVLPLDFSRWHFDIAAGKRPIAPPTEANYRKHRALREAYVEAAIPAVREALTKAVAPSVVIDSTEAAWSLMENGDARYLFVYNCNVDKANRFAVGCINLPGVIYDVEAGRHAPIEITEEGVQRFDVDLPAGGWKVFALAPARIAHVRVSQARLRGGTLGFRVALFDEQHKEFRAAVPLKITLKGADGKEFAFYRATNAGSLDLSVPVGGSVPTPATVSVHELFSGKTAEARVAAR